MTTLPDWLVERAALDEVPTASRDRIVRAEPSELAERIAALREDNARELASHPAGPAVAQIEARITAARRLAARRRRVRWSVLAAATSAMGILMVIRLAGTSTHDDPMRPAAQLDDGTRVKGATRLLVFRQVGARAERLEHDALVRVGDVIQLRYNGGGKRYGVIASVDGAGEVSLHYPAAEDAPPEATALAAETTALAEAYALDDAPRFERFFFITANEPIDLPQSLLALRTLARRDDSADAALELPPRLSQWSFRLRKVDVPSPNHESPQGTP